MITEPIYYFLNEGFLREVQLQDTGSDDTVGKIFYEINGKRLRAVDAGGKKRELEGNLV